MNRKELLLALLKDDPQDRFARYALALEYRKENLLQKAQEVFEALKKDHPDYLPLYYQLGKLMEEAGDEQKALHVYQEGLSLAITQKDMKTRSELEEAIWMLED